MACQHKDQNNARKAAQAEAKKTKLVEKKEDNQGKTLAAIETMRRKQVSGDEILLIAELEAKLKFEAEDKLLPNNRSANNPHAQKIKRKLLETFPYLTELRLKYLGYSKQEYKGALERHLEHLRKEREDQQPHKQQPQRSNQDRTDT